MLYIHPSSAFCKLDCLAVCTHTWRSPSTHDVARFYSLCARIRCRVIRSRFNQNGRTFAIISAHNCAISEIYLSYLLGNLPFKSLPENSTNALTKFQHSRPGDADWTLSALFASRMNLFDLYFISRSGRLATYGSVSAGREKWPFNVLFFF